MADQTPLAITASRHFLSWLHDTGLSLAFTTYQTNRLFLIGVKHDGQLSAFERLFDRPMGLHANAERLYLSTRWQIWELDNVLPDGKTYKGYDRLYVPHRAHTTGELDVHDVAVDSDGRVVFVNTAYSCLAALSEHYSFKPLWKPPFISRLAPEDRCHLNGLAIVDGAPAYVTTVSRSDVAAGWRERRHTGGCVIDVEDDEIVLDSLSMPHSPRVYRKRLWLLNSGTGELGYVDRAHGRFEPVAFCPGYVRGLAFHGDYAVVGLSKQRHERTFSDLALDDKLHQKDAEPRCGLWVIDLRTGNVAHRVELEGVVIELYDVQVLPGVRRPMALGFKTDEIRRLVTIDASPRPVFTELPAETTSAVQSSAAPEARIRITIPGVPSPPRAEMPAAAREAYTRANGLAREGRFADAVPYYEEVLQQVPEHEHSLINLATVLHRLGEHERGLDLYRRAIAAHPRSVRAHSNLATVLREMGRLADAIRHYRQALEVAPDNAEGLSQLGLALYEQGQLSEAKACFENAIRAAPKSAQAYNNLAGILKIELKHDEALELHQRAAELDPQFFEAQENIGKIFEEQGRTAEAKGAYQRALAIRDDAVLALHHELLCPPVFPSTAALDAYRDHAASVIAAFSARELRLDLAQAQSSRAEPPFEWTYHGRDNRPLKQRYAELFASSFSRGSPERTPSAQGPWQVGFAVTPGHEGVFVRCMSGIIDRLDPRRFRVTLLCARPGERVLRAAIRRSDVRYIRFPLRFDHTVTAVRAAKLDVLYLWEVGTDSTNYFLAFCRLAPVQCTGWGWPDTSGAPELDHHLTSEALATAESDEQFSERLVRLPCLPPYFFRPPIAAEPRPASDFGLPADRHLYLCAQNLRKLHPDFDALIGGILSQDRRGMVVLVNDAHPRPGDLLRQRWSETLEDVMDRILLLPRLSPEDYFYLIARADVILDTPYFGGANTIYDALAAGTPVVTLPGPFPRSRYAYALYRKIGIDDGIAGSVVEYVRRAVHLGTDRAYRADVSQRIRASAPMLFEDRAAVEQMEMYLAGACCAARG